MAEKTSLRILVVDDESDYRLAIKDMLESTGFEVMTAANGEKGLEFLPAFKPDLVLVDWKMPRMDGEGFCRALRLSPEHRDTPVIMLTVRREPEDEMEALHFGADGFLAKPFKREELLARVRAALRFAHPA